MANFFIVIDMQNDFCTGALANKDAVAIIPRIKEELEKARAKGDNIVFTKDSHTSEYMNSNEGKHLPVQHCIMFTEGWEIVPELKPNADKEMIVNKSHFGFPNWRDIVAEGDTVTLVGTCTDICVVSNALVLKTIEGVEVNIIADCCAGLSKEKHEHALDVMASCQCNII
jgi:nicotinamidase-related amidase